MDGAFSRLAFVGSRVGHLDTVIDAVPYQMHEGIVEFVYDGLVEFGLSPFSDYLDLFSKFLRKVSDESFKFAEGAADWRILIFMCVCPSTQRSASPLPLQWPPAAGL